MAIPIFTVDAFADRPFRGNPAGVCLLEEPAEASWMQAVAREMNLSETAFLYREHDGFRLRWFTPLVEVELCGHATLASAHILWQEGVLLKEEEARFHTLSGLLTARRDGDWIEMNFPAKADEPVSIPEGLAEALWVKPIYVGKTVYDYLVEVDGEETVRAMSPDMKALRDIPARGFIVTSRARSGGFDFVSRFFAPAVGVDEDPVTGSAHSSLGPYWQRKLGKREFTAFQASERGGVIRVRVSEDRVFIAGQAVTVFKGVLAL